MIGETLADLPPMQGAVEYVLDSKAMLTLLEDLRFAGFMRPDAYEVPDGVALVRSLQLVIDGSRSQSRAPSPPTPAFDQMVTNLDRTTQGERSR